MVVLVFLCISFFFGWILTAAKVSSLQNELKSLGRRYSDLESKAATDIKNAEKTYADAQEKLAKAEVRLTRAEGKEEKAEEAIAEVKKSKSELAREKDQIARDTAKLGSLREDITAENKVLRSAVEEITNLWINDSWKSISDRLTSENYATQKTRMEKVECGRFDGDEQP